LAADVFEIVVLTVEVVAVGKHHPRKAEGLILHLEILGEAAEKALLHALVFQIGSAIDGLAEVHAAKEIAIILRNGTKLRILNEVLEIGLDDGSASREHLGQTLFALDKSVDHLVHGGRSGQRGGRLRLSIGYRSLTCRLRSGGRADGLLSESAERSQQSRGDEPFRSTHNSYLLVQPLLVRQ